MAKESTLVRSVPDFFDDVEAYFNAKTDPAADVTPVTEIIFDPEDSERTYNQSVVRQYLYEYLVKRCHFTKTDPYHFDSRHYFIAKGVKDYLILTGKEKFTFADVAEMIQSNSIVNYISDMLQQMMLKVWKWYSGRDVNINSREFASESLSVIIFHDY